MAPKQVPISELGAPAKNGNGWRAQAKIDGIIAFGPQRATKKEAWADVALARQSTSREAYARCLEQMRATVNVPFFSFGRLTPLLYLLSGFQQPLL